MDYDVRKTGWSSTLCGCTAGSLLVAMLDYLGIDGADAYGTSMGGRLAQQLAARHPHRVRALGIGCTSPGGPHGIGRDSVVSRSLVQHEGGAARQVPF
ncbi:alpha/beta fold hydrolase [Streptomyces sp. NPDC087428]|uniref:alpha/beta fold hydrolase n=1 Tax=Streptomyces sp. NPDC087428 TaxID=3365788 RepID=UPI0037FAB821